MKEEIKKHPAWNVEVSNRGYVIRPNGCKVIPTQRLDTGYYVVNIGQNRIKRIHRLVAETFLPNPENLQDVNHIDGNKQNNAVNNLEWISRGENIKHAYTSGLREQTKGELSTSSKITLQQAQDIYNSYETDGYNSNTKELAEKYNLSQPYIRDIIRGQNSSGKSIWPEVNRERIFPPVIRGGNGRGRTIIPRELKNIDDRALGVSRPIAQLDKRTREVIKTFPSANEATKQTGVNHVGSCANGRRASAGGFLWQYLDE